MAETIRSRQVIAAVTTVGVVAGLADMPYGYYSLLRLAVCGFSLFLLFGDNPVKTDWRRWVTGGCAVLYNPVLPVVIGEKDIWIILNFLTAAWFWILTVKRLPTKREVSSLVGLAALLTAVPCLVLLVEYGAEVASVVVPVLLVAGVAFAVTARDYYRDLIDDGYTDRMLFWNAVLILALLLAVALLPGPGLTGQSSPAPQHPTATRIPAINEPPQTESVVPEAPLMLIAISEISGQPVASVSAGNRVVLAKEGETVEGLYRVVKIGTASIIVDYLDGRGRRTIPLSKD